MTENAITHYSPMPVSYIKFLSAVLSPGEHVADVCREQGAAGETVLTFITQTNTRISLPFTPECLARLRACLT